MTTLASDIYLDSFLAPLAPFLARDDVTDIFINRPQEVWIERLACTPERIDVPSLTAQVLQRLVRQIAASCAQGVSREYPLLSASLPDGSRVQIILPPATRSEIAIAIRRHVLSGMSLDSYTQTGAFEATLVGEIEATGGEQIPELDVASALRSAVRRRKNILVSGGTSTGKTTFLNALLREIPAGERLITIEDTPELQITQPNAIGLIAMRGHTGEAHVTAEDLLIASLRMRPDRIILGEMRGNEALTFLRSVNTGHPGSMSTVHADSPDRAIDQLALLVLQSGTQMGWDEVIRYVRTSLDYIVQLKREDGRRMVDVVFAVKD